jgi:hypothetical protein
MGRVIIGMDPHKRSATIEVIDDRKKVLAQGRFGTDSDGCRAMLNVGRRYPDRTWAVEAVTALAGTSLSAWSPTANPWWTCPRNCPRELGKPDSHRPAPDRP